LGFIFVAQKPPTLSEEITQVCKVLKIQLSEKKQVIRINFVGIVEKFLSLSDILCN